MTQSEQLHMKDKYLAQIPSKIQMQHLSRLAIIYIRQSTLQQVERHNESTKLQYALVEKAYNLGWSREKIVIIDEDLGRSGSNAEGRPGFQKLVAEVSLDRVGMVFGIEISRLARSCRDWYQLLESCALFRTLIGDTDGIYDPGHYNDRLLLGLKGTMSEAELHIIKQRMLSGKKAKARRGELKMNLPVGYIYRPSGEINKDPDQQAQETIALIFKLFEQYRSCNAVLNFMVKNQIQMPYRENGGLRKGEIDWRRPNRTMIHNILTNPTYAGAYSYGRFPVDSRKKQPGQPYSGKTKAKQEDWEVLIKDKFPNYITWEKYERNKKQLAMNSNKMMGVVSRGSSRLSGLLTCSKCHSKLTTRYTSNGKHLRYLCQKHAVNYGDKRCTSLQGAQLESFVEEQVLEALQPSSLQISLKVAENLSQERESLLKHWQLRLERAKYEVERAFRQYNAAEPENRLVARALEQNWEKSLAAEEKLKQEYNQFIAEQPAVMTTEEREAICQLAGDFPTIWNATTTTNQQRQQIIRLLIDKIIINIPGNAEKVDLEIYWVGSHITYGQYIRSLSKIEQISYYPELIEYVKELQSAGKSYTAIAEALNKKGWYSAKYKKPFNQGIVETIISRAGLVTGRKRRAEAANRDKDEWTCSELALKTNVPRKKLHKYVREGKLQSRVDNSVSHGGIILVKADEAELQRIMSISKQSNKHWIEQNRIVIVEENPE